MPEYLAPGVYVEEIPWGGRKDVRIELHDAGGQMTATRRLTSALLVKYAAPGLNAAGNNIAIGEITLAHERLARDDAPPH